MKNCQKLPPPAGIGITTCVRIIFVGTRSRFISGARSVRPITVSGSFIRRLPVPQTGAEGKSKTHTRNILYFYVDRARSRTRTCYGPRTIIRLKFSCPDSVSSSFFQPHRHRRPPPPPPPAPACVFYTRTRTLINVENTRAHFSARHLSRPRNCSGYLFCFFPRRRRRCP